MIFISVFLVWVALWFLVSSIAKNFSYLDTTHWIRCKSVLLHVCIDIATRPLRNLLILSPPSVHNSQSQHSQRAWLTNELYFHLFVWLAFGRYEFISNFNSLDPSFVFLRIIAYGCGINALLTKSESTHLDIGQLIYLKKLRVSDWLKSSAFSCSTSAKL